MPASDGPDVVLQLAKSAVDDLALGRLAFLTERVGRSHVATIAGAECHLRWTRPSLSFPDDAPDQARLGLAFEGGARLPSGRLLSIDAFVTVTAPPRLARDDTGWFARLPFDHADIGEIQVTYAGQPLPDLAQRQAQGLPDDDTIARLRAGARAEIARICETLPDLPLTPPIAIDLPNPVMYAYIWPDSQGAALALSVSPSMDSANGALPLRVTQRANLAIALNAPTFAAHFAETIAQTRLPLPEAFAQSQAEVALADSQMRFTIQAEAAGERVSAQLTARPGWVDDALTLDVVQATANDPAHPLAERLLLAAQSDAVVSVLAEAAQTAITAIIRDLLRHSQAEGRTASEADLAFAPQALQISDGYISLAGRLPEAAAGTEPIVDGPSFDLRLTDFVRPGNQDQPIALTVSVVNLHNVEPPVDYAWWTSQDVAMREEHGAMLNLRVAVNADPDDTLPRQTRALPQGVVSAQAAIVDAFGRVARAALEIDTHGDSAVQLDHYATADTVPTPSESELLIAAQTRVLGEIPDDEPDTGASVAYSRMGTRLNATAYRPTMVLPLPQSPGQSSLLGMFAGALAMFAIFAAIAALVLSRALNPATALVPTPSPTVAAYVTPTLGISPTATMTTPGPTFTPQPFGRFATSPQSMQFDCSTPGLNTPTPTPNPGQSITLSNTGTELVKWTAEAVGWSSSSWASITPATGSLKPGASTTLAIAPDPSLCGIPSGTFLGIQFSATGVIPLTVQVTHT